MNHTILVTYDLIWQFKAHPHYQVSRCRKIINTQRGREVKRVLNSRSVGYWIAGNFIPLSKINHHIQKIIHEQIPF